MLNLSYYSTMYSFQKKRRFISVFLILIGIVIGVIITKVIQNHNEPFHFLVNADSSLIAQTLPQSTMISTGDYERAVVEAAKKAMPAVVSIHVTGTGVIRFRDPFFEMLYGRQLRQLSSMGSGVIIDNNGTIITNDHVLNPYGGKASINIKVMLTDGRMYSDAKLIKSLPAQDIAILSIKGENLPFIELGSSNVISPGQTVLAIGNPFGDTITGGLLGAEPTVTKGIISAKRRNLTIQSENITRYYRNLLQTDAAINEGNSGGALIDLNGKLIGINTAIYSPKNTGSIGIGFAINVDRIKIILDRLQKYGDVGQAVSGIEVQDITPPLATALNFSGNGVIVNSVDSGSPGEDAGIKRGDIIMKVDGYAITNSGEIVDIFNGAIPDESYTFTIFRNGDTKDLKLKLGKR
jgi:serine protease DegQ